MIALVRVDNRLVHGQIVETWVSRLGVRRILVADDDAAASPLARAAMSLALPEDFPVEVIPVAGIDWPARAGGAEPTLVLFREVASLSRAVAGGLTPALAPTINLGNVHFAPGRRGLTPSVFLREEEVAALRAFSAAGFTVEARAIPSDAPVPAEELARRWQSAG